MMSFHSTHRPAPWKTRSPWSAQYPACSPVSDQPAWTSQKPARWRCTMGSHWMGSWPWRTSRTSPTSARCCCTPTPSSTASPGTSRPSSTQRKTCWLSMWVDFQELRQQTTFRISYKTSYLIKNFKSSFPAYPCVAIRKLYSIFGKKRCC